MKKFFKHILLLGVGTVFVISFLLFWGSIIFTLNSPQSVIHIIERLLPEEQVAPLTIKGIAVVGDSQSDEYRADDSRGLTYASTTLNWVEQLQKYRQLNFGPWEKNNEPRRIGYAYNWARTGATVNSMIESGQDVGVAEQVKNGEVNVVVIYIGANDFAPYITPDGYDAIYNGTLTDEQVLRKKNRLVADITTAVDTIKTAGNPRILLILLPDWGHHLGVRVAFPLPEQRERVTRIIESANDDLVAMAKVRGITTLDPNVFYTTIFANDLSEIVVGKQRFNAVLPGDDPRFVFLDDGTHAGTVLNGLFANAVISVMNKDMGASIRPFSDEELLSHAGL